MAIGTIAGGILTAMGLARVSYSASGKLIHHTAFSQGLRSPLFQGGLWSRLYWRSLSRIWRY